MSGATFGQAARIAAALESIADSLLRLANPPVAVEPKAIPALLEPGLRDIGTKYPTPNPFIHHLNWTAE